MTARLKVLVSHGFYRDAPHLKATTTSRIRSYLPGRCSKQGLNLKLALGRWSYWKAAAPMSGEILWQNLNIA